MVFKPISHLARRSTKAFAHGYAQSLAAASQSSYASNTTFGQLHNNRYSSRGPSSRRDILYGATSLSNAVPKGHQPLVAHERSPDPGADALPTAWPRQQHDEELQSFPLFREGGWRIASSRRTKELGKILGVSSLAEPQPAVGHEEAVARSLDEPIQPEEVVADSTVRVGDPSAQVASLPAQPGGEAATDRPRSASCVPTVETIHGQPGSESTSFSTLLTLPTVSSETLHVVSIGSSPGEFLTSEQHAHVQHILDLERLGQHAAIPAVFEALLRLHAAPPTLAYNALMLSATTLAPSVSEAIPKVLDAYTDMLRRKVRPDARTYMTLLELLAARAIEVAEMRSSLRQKIVRFRGSGQTARFPIRSLDIEQEMVNEDASLRTALRLFKLATAGSRGGPLTSSTYSALIDACAASQEVDEMIKVYAHMEGNKVLPSARVYPPMIRAFASQGDLRSAVECYNEYKDLVSRSEAGQATSLGRIDAHVYAAVVGSYLRCGKSAGAEKFFAKILAALEPYGVALQEARDVITQRAFVAARIEKGQFREALNFVGNVAVSLEARDRSLDMISAAAADQGSAFAALEARGLITNPNLARDSAASLLAMHLRHGDMTAAQEAWGSFCELGEPDQSFIEPTVMYAAALIERDRTEEGLMQARQVFQRIRASNWAHLGTQQVLDMIDESVEYLHQVCAEHGPASSPTAAMGLLWMMVDNGGLLLRVAERILAGLGAHEIAALDSKDLDLALHVQAGVVGSDRNTLDIAHKDRFALLLTTALGSTVPISRRTAESVSSAVDRLKSTHPTLLSVWLAASQRIRSSNFQEYAPSVEPSSTATAPRSFGEEFDPYAKSLDSRGSSMIVDALERSVDNPTNCLNESLARFKNIRRAGRHPRYIAYAKLIGAAAKEGRIGLINDIYEMAKHDVPLIAQHPSVRHGWTSILDAMVGAYLAVGNRPLASGYHQELLQIGSTPTANTFGLYITTLKDSGKTFDEASEAVKIFQQARCEGVEPTSFLYNALIGKLGKARRIDDCLFYFAEMRAMGIRPTSVTYGTIVNALCRVSDERFAQDLFDEMESMPNYKPRPAPYNSMMQFFLTAKRDSSKVLEYYQRMQSRFIKPTMHTYKLLIDTYATLEPINLAAAEGVLETIRSSGQSPEAIHYASLIHAKGCVLQDMDGAQKIFEGVSRDRRVRPQACLYQAYFESMVANHRVRDTDPVLRDMYANGVDMTPYIGNTLIHGWTLDRNIGAAKAVYDSIAVEKREPSTYEAMTRGFLASGERQGASAVVQEMMSRGYPSAVSGKILELLSHRGPDDTFVTPLGLLSK